MNIIFFISRSLTKKTLSFLFIVACSTMFLPRWSSILLLLIYIGGLFIVLTYVISFTFFYEKMFYLFLFTSLNILINLSIHLNEKIEYRFFYLGSNVQNNWFIYPILLLTVGLILISFTSPSRKRVRRGF